MHVTTRNHSFLQPGRAYPALDDKSMCQLGPSGLYVPQAHMHVHSMTRAVCAEEARHTESVRCHMEGASLAYKHYTIHVEKLEQARARAIHGDATVVTEIYIYDALGL